MVSDNNLAFFIEKLRCHIPEIEAVQLLTVDGLTLHDGVPSSNDDRLSALTALLSFGAEQLAACLSDSDAAVKGTVVCVDNIAYAVIRINSDLTLGIRTQENALPTYLLTQVHAVIAANSGCFNVSFSGGM